jgi:Na+-driven multidrug efflux pump
LGTCSALGIQGAGIATTTGRAIGVLIQLWFLFKGGKHIRVTFSQVYWNAKIMFNIFRTSLGGVGQMIVAMTSWIFLMRILAEIGSEAVAGATIAIRIMMFTLMPAWGIIQRRSNTCWTKPWCRSPRTCRISSMENRVLQYDLFDCGFGSIFFQ